MNKILLLILSLLLALVIRSAYNKIVEYYKPETEDPVLLKIRDRLAPVFPEIQKIKLYDANKSYTINKTQVHICMKDENGAYYHDNMLTYVLLHELAHVRCDEIGHTDKFYKIFQNLLDQASSAGLYNPSIPIVQNYCSV